MSDLLGHIQDEVLSHFLCEYSPKSPKQKLIDVVSSIASKNFSEDKVEEFIERRLDDLRGDIIREFNHRLEMDLPLRFRVADAFGEGNIIEGFGQRASDQRLRFQDCLNDLTPHDFEGLAALVLKRMQCDLVFTTPHSHDQGVDAFGYRAIVPSMSRAVTHRLVWIAQAKHYKQQAISTNVVREMVGTAELLVNKIFSTVDQRYKELGLTPYGPTALMLLTTQEITRTVRLLGERAGVFVFEASDLYELFADEIGRPTKRKLIRLIKKETADVTALA